MINGIYVSDIDRLKDDTTFQSYGGFERGMQCGNAVVKYFSKANCASVEKMKFINFETTRRVINEMRKHNKNFGRKIADIDFNLHHPRFLSLVSNQLYYQFAVLPYNLKKAIQYLYLDGHYFFMRVRRFISHFILITGKLIKHSREQIIKLIRYPYDEKRLRRILMMT